MREVKFGVIGVGFWGRNQARVLSGLEGANLVAVCDVDQVRAKNVGEKYGVSWYTENAELLRRNDIDAVCICTPTITHHRIALEAIKAGKHVLVEKPMAESPKEAEEILSVAEQKGVYLMTGFIERFNPGVQKVKKLIDDGVLGKVVLAFARRVGRWPERVGDIGVVKDSAIHDIDIMRFLFEEDVASVYARAGSLGHKLEDYAQIILGFSGNRTAFVEANWLTPRKVRMLTVTGTDAIAAVDYVTQEITVSNAEKSVTPNFKWEEPLMLELRHFTESIISGRNPDVTGLDGLKALEVAEAALRSARTGEKVMLA